VGKSAPVLARYTAVFPRFTQKPVAALFLMDALTADAAQYLLFPILLAAFFIWLTLSRPDKVGLAVQGMVSLVIVVVLVKLAAVAHTDLRPFVVDPSVKALFVHPADNGFPSDHTAMGVTVALLVMRYRRWQGAVLLVASIFLGVARVASQVHHAQDIVAGALIAAVAVGIATSTGLDGRSLSASET
jgi:membrane-associated phospholipid phosphatase